MSAGTAESRADDAETSGPPNWDLLLPYCAPYFAYVALGSLLGNGPGSAWTYALRLVAVPALLAWGWSRYVPLVGPGSRLVSAGVGALAGAVGAALWVLLLRPFVPAGAEPWTGLGFCLRLAAAGLVVPVFEELLMRGYVLRVALQWDRERRSGAAAPLDAALHERRIGGVEPGAWSVWAVAVSTAAFAAGHAVNQWPASVAYGLLMAGLWIVRKDLISCIVAHGVTNVALALYARATGQWGVW